MASEAVALFTNRARAALPGFAVTENNAPTVAGICRRLDGMPLAIELAAARVPLLAVEEIAARLTDRFRLLTTSDRTAPSRQQTLRATLDWSYELLSTDERLLFERLSVFVGGWTIEAAEAVGAGDGIESGEVLGLLGRVVDKSLVLAEPASPHGTRYRMLETLRAYGREELARRGEAEKEATEGRHAAFFVELAEAAEPELLRAGQVASLARLDHEHDNIRAALRWLIDRRDVAGAQRLAGAVRLFWLTRGHLSEGRAWLAETLALETTGSPPTQEASAIDQAFSDSGADEAPETARVARRAKALHGLANLAMLQGDYDAARDADRAALPLWRLLGDQAAAAFSLLVLGEVEMYRGDSTRARQFFEEGIAAARASGAGPVPLALNLFFSSQLACDAGDHASARRMGEEALALSYQVGFSRTICGSLMALSDLSYQEGNAEEARRLLEEMLATAQEAGDPMWTSSAVAGLGRLAADAGDYSGARSLFLESLTLARDLGDRLRIAQSLEEVAQLAASMQRAPDAVRLAAAAMGLRDAIGARLRPIEQARLDPCLVAVRSGLGQAAADEAWERAAQRRWSRPSYVPWSCSNPKPRVIFGKQ